MSINEYTETLRHDIDSALDFATKLNADCPHRLREAIRYSLLAPGKRLRPMLVLAAAELCSGADSHHEGQKKAMPAACAVEMIHGYSLIHDDLPALDNDDLRRGMPTCHRQFDEATAILAGDALQALAFEMIGNLSPPELAGRCCKELAVAVGACQLVGGQMDDMLHEQRKNDIDSAVRAMAHVHHRKTGAVIRISLKLGGIIADASQQQLSALDEFGKSFGLAFQITDDLLDAIGEENAVGKRLRKDPLLGKWSYPSLLGIDEAMLAAKKAAKDAEQALSTFPQDSLPLQLLLDFVRQMPNRKK